MKIILNVSQFDDGNLTVEANIFQKPLTSLLTRGRLVSRPCWGLAGRFQNTHKICLRRSKQKTHEHVCSTQISAVKIDWCLTARNISEDPWEWADPGASAGPVPRSPLRGSWQADCWENSEWSYIQACGWLTRQLIYNRFPIIGQGFFFFSGWIIHWNVLQVSLRLLTVVSEHCLLEKKALVLLPLTSGCNFSDSQSFL